MFVKNHSKESKERLRSLISVIIPCYKQGHFLPDCVASLKKQTCANWEAIIVDDGSPDDTARIAQELAENDKRVLFVRQPNRGLSAARNTGLRYAHGDYVQFLDADDLLLPHKFEAHLKIATISSRQTITYTDYFDSDYRDLKLRVNAGRLSCHLVMLRPLLDFSARWEHDLSIPIHSPLFPWHLLQELDGPFDESLPNHEDWDLWMRLARLGSEFIFIPEKLAIYRHGIKSMSRNGISMRNGFESAIQKHMKTLGSDRKSILCLRYLSHVNNCRHSKGLRKWLYRAAVLYSSMLLPTEVRSVLSPNVHFKKFICSLIGRKFRSDACDNETGN